MDPTPELRVSHGFNALFGGLILFGTMAFRVAEICAPAGSGCRVGSLQGSLSDLYPNARRFVVRWAMCREGSGIFSRLIPVRRRSCLHSFPTSWKEAFQTPGGIRARTIEGVAGPESANNSATAEDWFPCWLGFPCPAHGRPPERPDDHGSSRTPADDQHPQLFWTVIASMYLGNILS